MIDLHSHILWGLDDGAQSRDEALAMARMAAADGIRVMVATPHSPGNTASMVYDPALIRSQVDELNGLLAAEGVALEIRAGTEIAYEASIPDQLARGALMPYAGSRVILLEPPWSFPGLPPSLDTLLFTLQIAGYRVVLAHPERLDEVQEDPNRLIPLIERGVLMQVTAAALAGQQGERLRATAETLLTHQMVHVLASDTHGLPPRRPPLLSAARASAAALAGEQVAAALVEGNPQALLEDRPVALPPPRPAPSRRRRR